jgi:GTP-binding protein HflX
VFERHARSKRARIQVEIAHLEYLRPRIRGIGLNMDQQTGGMGPARGPGETASELLARRLDGRLADLKRSLEVLERSGAVQRKHRDDCSRIVLVGYTNAGKTSLMNGLTAANLSSRNRPFETLDTTSRCLTRHGGDVLISDTVGFIRRLPERLFASFESTLAELVEASLLAVVVDVSDPEREEHLEITEQLLGKLGAESVPRFYVFNKVDRLETELNAVEPVRWSRGHPYRVLSSRDREAVSELEGALLANVRSTLACRRVFVPYRASGVTRAIYAECRVIETTASERGMQFLIEGKPHVVERIALQAKESLV